MLLSEQAYKKIDRELAKFPADQRQSAVMAALAIAQDERGWVSPEVMQDLEITSACLRLRFRKWRRFTTCMT